MLYDVYDLDTVSKRVGIHQGKRSTTAAMELFNPLIWRFSVILEGAKLPPLLFYRPISTRSQ